MSIFNYQIKARAAFFDVTQKNVLGHRHVINIKREERPAKPVKYQHNPWYKSQSKNSIYSPLATYIALNIVVVSQFVPWQPDGVITTNRLILFGFNLIDSRRRCIIGADFFHSSAFHRHGATLNNDNNHCIFQN